MSKSRYKIFERRAPKKNINRNTVDLSFDNHLSLQFGKLYPVFCKSFLPGETALIKPEFGFNFMPMVFPVQSRIRASLNFFAVPLRTIWEGWEEFNTQPDSGIEVPCISQPKSSRMFRTGSLADYLGVATEGFTEVNVLNNTTPTVVYGTSGGLNVGDTLKTTTASTSYRYAQSAVIAWPQSPDYLTEISFARNVSSPYMQIGIGLVSATGPIVLATEVLDTVVDIKIESGRYYIRRKNSIKVSAFLAKFYELYKAHYEEYGSNDNYELVFLVAPAPAQTSTSSPAVTQLSTKVIQRVDDTNHPCYNDVASGKRLPCNALRFRAYEAVYNAYYRNELIEPLVIDGKPNYTKWCRNMSSGQDTTPYDFYYQNWETDVFTGCYPSPQQGLAPLAGVSTHVGVDGTFSFNMTEGNGAITVNGEKQEVNDWIITTNVTPTGDITGISKVSEDTPQEYVHYVKDIIRQGISINTLRNCNMLQTLYENAMRAGYRYRDYMRGMWGTDPGPDALQMPVYLGGATETVNITKVTSQGTYKVNDSYSPLGDYAGQASLYKVGKGISHYCNDYCYIIGIMHLTVNPIYTQAMDKDFFKTNFLDWYRDEFKNAGLQPLYTHEIAPIQNYLDPNGSVTDVFGYQRYGYPELMALDEAHGQMRTTLSNYLLMRKFLSTPKLSSEFLHVDPAQLNDVFSLQTIDNDIAIGQVRFNYKKKTVVPQMSIPRL